MHWLEKQQEAYDILISLIAQPPVLKYFDRKSDISHITVSVDASSEGLSACLLQGNQPVAYASRALNQSEYNYAQVEKEMLAIVYSTTKFHEYIYGKTVIVETDHKPLESLFKKALGKAPQRLQRVILKVQQYDLKVKYVSDNTLYIDHTLSRAGPNNKAECISDSEEFEVNLIVPICKEKKEEFKMEMDQDLVMLKLKEMVLRGRPDKMSDVDNDLQAYWNFRDELCICYGLLMRGDRLITPPSLQKEMVDKIHSSHLGMEKCLNRARDCLFWSGITKQIQEKLEQCQICNRYRNQQGKEPLMPHEVLDRPWKMEAADLFVFGTDKYSVLVDYYSKYFELNQLLDGTSNTVVNVFKQYFARHGIPEMLYTDNGPEFASKEFSVFAKNYQFQHVTSSPRFPQSNGLVERTIQTVKKC